MEFKVATCAKNMQVCNHLLHLCNWESLEIYIEESFWILYENLSLSQVVRVPAIGETKAVDATGAGDLFAGGFLYGLVKGLSLEECCRVGSCSGGSVIRSLGGEVSPENWQWMYKQMKSKGLSVPVLVNNAIWNRRPMVSQKCWKHVFFIMHMIV